MMKIKAVYESDIKKALKEYKTFADSWNNNTEKNKIFMSVIK